MHMGESTQKHEAQRTARKEGSGVHRRPEGQMEDGRDAASAEMQKLEREYRHDKAFDPRIQIMTAQQHNKRAEADRRTERDKLEASHAWTKATDKELRKPYEVRRQRDLIAMDQRVIAAENDTQALTDMLTSLAEGDATKADAWFAEQEADAAKDLQERVRQASMFKNAAMHPEARVDWENLESLTRKAEAAERDVAHAQERLRRLGDKRRYLTLLATINRK